MIFEGCSENYLYLFLFSILDTFILVHGSCDWSSDVCSSDLNSEDEDDDDGDDDDASNDDDGDASSIDEMST